MSKQKLTNSESHVFLIWSLYLLGYLIRLFANGFKTSDSKWIYDSGWIVASVIVSVALIWAMINTLWIINAREQSGSRRFVWATLSITPFVYNVAGMIFELLR